MATAKSKDVEKEKIDNSADIQKLLKEIENLKSQINSMQKEENVVTNIEDTNKEKLITFISLAKGSVLLRGTASRPYEMEGQFSTRTFTEAEAKAIVTLMGSYMREGFVFIDDAKFVREMGLSEAYRNMLTPEMLKNLFNNNSAYIISAYQNASEGQRKIIMDLVYERKANGETVDANILMALSKISGIDLMTTDDD